MSNTAWSRNLEGYDVTADFVSPWPQADPAIVSPVPIHDDLRELVRHVADRQGSYEQLRVSVESGLGYPGELWAALTTDVAAGALAIPEHLGGLGLGLRELGVVLEESGAALVSAPLLASAVLGAHVLSRSSRPGEYSELLGSVLDGNVVATVALDGDIDVAAGPGGTLTGSGVLPRVLQGSIADVLIAPVTHHGRRIMGVVDLAGEHVERRDVRVVDTTRRQAEVRLDSAPVRPLITPDEFDAVRASLSTLTAIAVASEHVGMIERLLDMTKAYVTQREQFDRPIGSFQVVKHRLADVLVDLERARSAARYACAVFADDAAQAELPAAVAGAVCIDAVIRAAHEAVQLHGGIGFTWEHPAHLYLRRALGDEGLFGDGRRYRAIIAELVGLTAASAPRVLTAEGATGILT